MFINVDSALSLMKLLAFTDIHENMSLMRRIEAMMKKEHPDLVVCAGDFTVFEQHLDEMINWLSKIPVPVYLIHGNHEEEAVIRKICSHKNNLRFIHAKVIDFKGIGFTGWGGGGFAVKEKEFERFMLAAKDVLSRFDKIVLVTHGPPYGNALDHLWRENVGNKSYSNFIKKQKNCVLAISGHLHENFGKEAKLGNARLVNPGPQGIIIEL